MKSFNNKKINKKFTFCFIIVSFIFTSCRQTSKLNTVSSYYDASSEEITVDDSREYDFTVCYTGDICLADNGYTTNILNSSENGVYDCISPEYIETMQNADVCVINNEFQLSTKGRPMSGKLYTFEGSPEYVNVLTELGVDIANLANNHVYDYGKDALAETLDTLHNAGIKTMGAGNNLTEAMTPVYIEIQGKTVAFVSASRAEKYKLTPQATEDSPGILRCYDNSLFIDEIREAKQNADFVIAYVHWGTENTNVLEDVQMTTGKEYLDAGADVVVGAHPHCLQGMEYYDGKPIIYSLGNFWFDQYTMYTEILSLHFTGDDDNSQITVSVIPGVQTGGKVVCYTDYDDCRRVYDYLESISINVQIDDSGVVTEKQ